MRHLDRVAAPAISSWEKPSGSPAATRSCSATRSSAGDHLGDRVFDLQPGVHLEEVEAAVLVEELDGSRTFVAAGGGDADGRVAHRGRTSPEIPGAGVSSTSFWWRRWLEQSRSPNQTVSPKRSETICIST